MDHLDDTQKQYAREALQHFKNGLDKIRQLKMEVGQSPAGRNIAAGITQIESGLRTALAGMTSNNEFDPTAELRGAYGNTYGPTGQRIAGQEGATGNEFPDAKEKQAKA